MKVLILAGGMGTRISEYTKMIPKPMIKICGRPILAHIMKLYLKWGYKDFYIAGGYKNQVIKKYFKNFKKEKQKFKFTLDKKKCFVTILNTGLKTMTGGRIRSMEKFLLKNENFMFTYGDGISNVNLKKLQKFHHKNNKLITVTAVRPPARFGEIELKKNIVKSFKEKPQVNYGWINGGFFIAKKEFIKFIKNGSSILEKEPLEKATATKQLNAFKHYGFWKCMDTKRDKDELEKLIKQSHFKKKLGL